MKPGQKFEMEVEDFFRFVTQESSDATRISRDESVTGPDGNRQCDIVIEHKFANLTYKTLIECKDYKGKVPILHIDALVSKMDDLGFHKGVMISKSGFQKGAKEKAIRKGIQLAKFSEYDKKLQMSRTPLIHAKCTIIDAAITFDASPDFDYGAPALGTKVFDQTGLGELFLRFFRPAKSNNTTVGHKKLPENEFTVSGFVNNGPGLWLETVFELSNIRIFAKVKNEVYIGSISDSPKVWMMQSETNDDDQYYIPIDAVQEIESNLTKILSNEDIPRYLEKCPIMTYSFNGSVQKSPTGTFRLTDVKETFRDHYPFQIDNLGKWVRVFGAPSV